jgi:branched-subunit amino acid transport protein
MTGPPDWAVWTVILVLGAGTYLLRLSLLGTLGGRDLPPLALRLLKYTPVAVLPALVAPLVVWPAATGGAPDAPRMLAALVALAVGAWARSVLGAIAAGMATLYLALWALG